MSDLGLDVLDEKLMFRIAVNIKRHVHHSKLSVYQRVNSYYGDDSSDFIKTTLACKIKTHQELSQAPDSELIWNNPNF